MEATTLKRFGSLPVILLAAVIQGWALYGLHHAIDFRHWPATSSSMLIASYAVFAFTPLTIQLLAEHSRSRYLWGYIAAQSVLLFYFGWHHGADVYDRPIAEFIKSGDFFPIGFVITLLGLQILPFIQGRLSTGDWQFEYRLLFAMAWRNILVLAEAALFTGLFWLLLLLWQSLFDMLGIGFFKELFKEPIFAYPVSSLAFGIALHLMGSLERVTSVLLEQLLNLLKWLAVVAGLILLLFSIALVFKLPGVIASGQKAIGAEWLLGLVAVYLLLTNAAYRDGSIAQPYPRWLSQGLRYIVPLMIVVALTALYALYVRTQQYGMTVSRFWGWVVAGSALVHSIGYSIAAVKRQANPGHWLLGIGRVNVVASLWLMAALALTLTPVLSPYRLAADSQYSRALEFDPTLKRDSYSSTPFSYLRFDAGRYGRENLHRLTDLHDHPQAARINKEAARVLATSQRWESQQVDYTNVVASLKIFPAGRTLDDPTRKLIALGMSKHRSFFAGDEMDAVGLFVDLNENGSEEFVLLARGGGLVYLRDSDGWKQVATVDVRADDSSWGTWLAAMDKGEFGAVVRPFRNLKIGEHVLEVHN